MVKFNGRVDTVQPEKLAEGYAQLDQNSDRSLEQAWRTRQGLAATDIALLDGPIRCVKRVEVGMGNGLIICHNDKISGFAVGRGDFPAPAWTPGPPPGGYVQAPTVTLAVSGADVVVSWSHVNSWAVGANVYRNGILLYSGALLSYTDSPDCFFDKDKYEVESYCPSGATSARTVARLKVTTVFSDDFNRANGKLADGVWADVANDSVYILNNVVQEDNKSVWGSVKAAALAALRPPVRIRAVVGVTGTHPVNSPQGPYLVLQNATAGNHHYFAEVRWRPGRYRLAIFKDAALVVQSAEIDGDPPDGVLEFTAYTSTATLTFDGHEVTGASDYGARTYRPGLLLRANDLAGAATVWEDNFSVKQAGA